MFWKENQRICSYNLLKYIFSSSELLIHKRCFCSNLPTDFLENVFSEDILVTGCFHLNLKFISESSSEAVTRSCSVKKVFLKISQNSQENTCATVPFFFQTCIFIKKETLTHVFCCKFCDIFQNTFFYRTPLVALLFLKHWLGLEIKLKVFRWLTILQNNSSSWSMKVKLVFEWFQIKKISLFYSYFITLFLFYSLTDSFNRSNFWNNFSNDESLFQFFVSVFMAIPWPHCFAFMYSSLTLP